MTNSEKHIENKVEETLKAFDDMRRAAPNPFLFTRILAGLEKRSSGSWIQHSLSPLLQRMALAAILLVILFNLYTVSRIFINSTAEGTLSAREQVFVEEFYPSTPTLYNISQPVSNP